MINDYVATGQVYYEYRDFPFLGDESTTAAHASRCADEQSKFWQFHTAVYHNQVQGARYDTGALGEKRLLDIARIAGLDEDAYTTCMDDGEYYDAIEQERANGQANGVNATPSFIINGELTSGALYTDIQPVIEAKLEEAQQ